MSSEQVNLLISRDKLPSEDGSSVHRKFTSGEKKKKLRKKIKEEDMQPSFGGYNNQFKNGHCPAAGHFTQKKDGNKSN